MHGFHWMDPNAHSLSSDIPDMEGSKQKTNKSKPIHFHKLFSWNYEKEFVFKEKLKKEEKKIQMSVHMFEINVN